MMDIMLPAIRHACEDIADDIATKRMEGYDAYMIAFRPKIRAFIQVTGPFLQAYEPAIAVKEMQRRIKVVKDACDHAIDEVFDGIEEERDIKIEFSLGAQSPQSTI
jgi:hypothetical protein